MSKQENPRQCFVIAPMGDEGSDIRIRSDQVLKHIIKPAAKDCGYEAIRADEISEPGIITSQVIQRLVDDPLVIADLTGRNANVFYELAVRHAVRKPCVHIIKVGESIPFDVAQSRTIQVDHHDLDSVDRCREELVRQIHSVERDPSDIDTPISVAVDLQSLRQSDNPLEKSNAEIISMLQDLRNMVGELGSGSTKYSRIPPGLLEAVAIEFRRLRQLVELGEDSEPNREILERVAFLVGRIEQLVHTIVVESGQPSVVGEHFLGLLRGMPIDRRHK